MCENNPNEQFFSDLTYVSGLQPAIDPPTARVVIDDNGEPECGKCNSCYGVICTLIRIAVYICSWSFVLLEAWPLQWLIGMCVCMLCVCVCVCVFVWRSRME